MATKADNPFEQALTDYLTEHNAELLAEKKDKTIKGCARYIIGEARKKAQANCAVMTDAEVYGLAVHYFEEDSIKEEAQTTQAARVERKAESKPKTPPKEETAEKPHPAAKSEAPAQAIETKARPKGVSDDQMDIFSLLTGETLTGGEA